MAMPRGPWPGPGPSMDPPGPRGTLSSVKRPLAVLAFSPNKPGRRRHDRPAERVLELKFTACLPAKLLRAMNAADIGYALECSGSEAAAKAFNPGIKASNPKNMMKGDSYCIERFVLEA
jgi:hypothetical protein